MPEAGFFEQKRGSPTGFALVVAAHVAALGALALVKGPEFIRPLNPPLVITPIDIPDDPPPEPPRPRAEPRQPSHMTVAPTPAPGPTDFITIQRPPQPPIFDTRPPGPVEIARFETPTPVRREAELIPRDLQPPYPTAEQRAQRSGTVRIRLTIGPDGRVTGVERLQATSDAFWRVTERQALSRWRFRPATLDGRPIAATRVMTVTFRIEDL